ncbi:MAG: PKD domain-containing protein [Candidatus Bipolaricaulota bacterium]|nr:PKD domain-containing protein [Candidatus Bipolaricaulota bacterium]
MPTGSGAVTKSPDKTTYCNETVSLHAEEVSDWRFDHWSGDASGSQNPLSVSMDRNREIVANYVPVCSYSLSVSVSGSGNVNRSPDKTAYCNGDSVTLTADPAVGWKFDHWSGALTGSTNPKSVAMSGSKSVTAYFSQDCSYNLDVTTTGQGTVARSPDKTAYCNGDSVTLTAAPAAGWKFDHWSGALTGSTNPKSVTMSGSKSVAAYFVQNCSYNLDVTTTGQGTVARSPDKTAYCSGDPVTLTANPAAGWAFDHWGGAATGNTNPKSITMSGDRSLTAYFTQIVLRPSFGVSLPGWTQPADFGSFVAAMLGIAGMSLVPSAIPPVFPIGRPIVLDASGSESSAGIVEYTWAFGDGESLKTTGPAATHTFALPGLRTVTLTVTDTGGRVALAQRLIALVDPDSAPTDGTKTPTSSGSNNWTFSPPWEKCVSQGFGASDSCSSASGTGSVAIRLEPNSPVYGTSVEKDYALAFRWTAPTSGDYEITFKRHRWGSESIDAVTLNPAGFLQGARADYSYVVGCVVGSTSPTCSIVKGSEQAYFSFFAGSYVGQRDIAAEANDTYTLAAHLDGGQTYLFGFGLSLRVSLSQIALPRASMGFTDVIEITDTVTTPGATGGMIVTFKKNVYSIVLNCELSEVIITRK